MLYVAMVAVFLLLSTSYVFASETEPSEPTDVNLTCDTAEDFEVSWHGGEWQKFVPVGWTESNEQVHPAYEFITDDSPEPTHSHITGLGTRPFEATGPEPQQKIVFGVPVVRVPNDTNGSRWWGIMRIRWRCRTSVEVSGVIHNGPVFDWSAQSWWVLVIDTKTLGRPR